MIGYRPPKPRRRWCVSRKLAVALLALMMLAALWGAGEALAQSLERRFSGSTIHDSYRQEGVLPWAMVTANDVNFRAGPGMECRVICQRSYGTAVEIVDEWQGWYKVLHWTHDEPMWVFGKYLEMVD